LAEFNQKNRLPKIRRKRIQLAENPQKKSVSRPNAKYGKNSAGVYKFATNRNENFSFHSQTKRFLSFCLQIFFVTLTFKGKPETGMSGESLRVTNNSLLFNDDFQIE